MVQRAGANSQDPQDRGGLTEAMNEKAIILTWGGKNHE